jgi:hypothetical protein
MLGRNDDIPSRHTIGYHGQIVHSDVSSELSSHKSDKYLRICRKLNNLTRWSKTSAPEKKGPKGQSSIRSKSLNWKSTKLFATIVPKELI